MKRVFILTFLLIVTSQCVLSQNNYKIINDDIKKKLEYSNSRNPDESSHTLIFNICEINISSVIESKEKMNAIMLEFSNMYSVIESNFDFEKSVWKIISKATISEELIKHILSKYDYTYDKYVEKYAVL